MEKNIEMATKDWVKSKQYTNVWFKGDTQKSISVKSGYDSMYHDDKYYAIYDWGKKRVTKTFSTMDKALSFAKAYMRKH